jgi:hypothetical protein
VEYLSRAGEEAGALWRGQAAEVGEELPAADVVLEGND